MTTQWRIFLLLIFQYVAAASGGVCPTCRGEGGKWVVSSGFNTRRIWVTCPTCSGTRQVPASNSQQFSQPSGQFQEEIVPQRQEEEDAARRTLAERKRQEEDQKTAQAAFDEDKQKALENLKGITPDDIQLKSIGSGRPLTLKAVDSSSAFNQVGGGFDSTTKGSFPATELKLLDSTTRPSSPKPFIVTDSMIVDARDVPSGLPTLVEDSIPDTPAGDRFRKGFQAITRRDWRVAVAWFQDALNRDPGNPELLRLVDFSQYTLKRHLEMHDLPFEKNSQPIHPASRPFSSDQISPELKEEMDIFFKLLVGPAVKAADRWLDEKVLIDMQLGVPDKTLPKPADPAWSKFTKWLDDNFGNKDEEQPKLQSIGAVRG